MPRKAPSLEGGVLEHRFTLGDYERTILQPYAENRLSMQQSLNIQNWVQTIGMTTAAVGGVVVVYIGVRLVSETWAKIEDAWDGASRWTTSYWVGRVRDRLAGKPREEGNLF